MKHGDKVWCIKYLGWIGVNLNLPLDQQYSDGGGGSGGGKRGDEGKVGQVKGTRARLLEIQLAGANVGKVHGWSLSPR